MASNQIGPKEMALREQRAVKKAKKGHNAIVAKLKTEIAGRKPSKPRS